MGLMYLAVMLIGTKNASSVLPVVAVERTVLYREQAAGMYSPLAYAFAQVRDFLFTLHSFIHVDHLSQWLNFLIFLYFHAGSN